VVFHYRLPEQSTVVTLTPSTSLRSSSDARRLSNWRDNPVRTTMLSDARRMEFGTLAIFVVKALFVRILPDLPMASRYLFQIDRYKGVVCRLLFVVEGEGGIFALDVGHIVGPLNYSRCDTKHRLPCTITPFY